MIVAMENNMPEVDFLRDTQLNINVIKEDVEYSMKNSVDGLIANGTDLVRQHIKAAVFLKRNSVTVCSTEKVDYLCHDSEMSKTKKPIEDIFYWGETCITKFLNTLKAGGYKVNVAQSTKGIFRKKNVYTLEISWE